jgi:hypothetical protein
MGAVAAGDEVAFEHLGFAVAPETDRRMPGRQILQHDVADLGKHCGVPPVRSLEPILLDFAWP